MGWAKQLVIFGLVPLLLAGCAGHGGSGVRTTGSTGTIYDPARTNGYSFKCSTPPSVNDWASELNAVQPQTQIAPVLHVQLPQPGKDQMSACLNAQFEARIEAMRRAKLFGDITVTHDGIAGFPAEDRGDEGYWMWVENNGLVLSYGKSMRSTLMVNSQRLEVWVTMLKPFLDNLKTIGDKNSQAVSTVSVGASNYFGYRGVEYIVFSDLRAALLANAEATALKTSPVKETGKTLLILTPPEHAVIDTWSKSVKNVNIPNASSNLGLITGTNSYASILQQAKSIEHSGLFKKTIIREEDAVDPDIAGYDAVLWIRSADTGKWYLHVKDHKTLQFKTLVTPEPDKWIEKVSTAIADARADRPSADVAAAPAPAATEAKKPYTFNVDGASYGSLEQVSAALKSKCDRLLAEITPTGGGRYSSLLFVMPDHIEAKGGSDDQKTAVTGFMNAINDADHDCMVSAIQKSALFKSVVIARDVDSWDFQNNDYKVSLRPYNSSLPAAWVVAKDHGGTETFPLGTNFSFAKSGDEQKMLQNLQGALDKLH